MARSEARRAALLLSPTALVLGLVVGYPLLSAVRESVFRSGDEVDESGFIVTGDRFVGADNYLAAFSGERFWNAFGNTTLFTVTTVAAEVVLGVVMALVMHRAMRGRALVRAAILVPWAIPTAVAGLLWQWIFQADGVANAVLGTELLWTADGWPSQLAVIIADTWKTAPFVGLLVLAGLQLIPNDVYEAARLDGASGWQQFWRVTLPLVKPALLVAVLFRLLDALRMFDLPFVLVGAQKASVETLSMLAWDEANQVRYGPAAAYAVLLFCYIAVVAFVFVKLLGADVLGERRARKTSEVSR
ncbi:carbohydrate ABC transporter permease [Saccharomonospora sp. NB11]|jgi:multiple sugar transport system permease protein|uniref:carbohydrate ABC transporter permease n=1 Tax=Saccharomonospora sp. NB11 TaxID=1642298 RepID=UPI0018D0707F|nr:sugar ABC transporter permease [Saccharomonospora sp. NB11]